MKEKQRTLRLLLVDDEAEFLSAAAAALQKRKLGVTAVQNGFEALDSLERERFDVAVVDLKMPGMTGEMLVQKMKQRRPELPVIILTGHGDSEHVARLSKEGIYFYLSKPCDMDDLASLVRQAADGEWRKWLRRLNFG
jgi:DNA-binding NtrC family response regulator